MRDRIDAVLGRVTMYRMLVIALTAIVVIGAVLAAAGVVTPLAAGSLASGLMPVAILVSAAVLVIWSVLVSRVFASLFRAAAHPESAIITGLILAILLSPTLDPVYLCVDALAATLAAASKYLIAAHGRHLLNPAAFGALAVYWLGLQFTPWWVGAPWLLPVVIVIGAAIVIRTRTAALVGVYLVAALAARAVVSLLTGVSVAEGLWFAVASGPLLFLGVVMLTEPLTLPPRRRQRMLVAAVVGVLLAVPFSLTGPTLGPIHLQAVSDPAFALLVGNVLAFLLARRRAIRLDYRGRRAVSPTAWELEFAPRGALAFEPGQYVELTLPHPRADSRGIRRVFSIASAPGDPVRLGMRLPAGRSSSFKRALAELEPGSTVGATAVAGDFVLPRDPAVPVLLVANGIGVTPFLSHALAGGGRDVVLVYAVSDAAELAFAEELAGTGIRVLVVAPTAPEGLAEHWRYLGPGPLTADALTAEVPDAAARATYLAGSPAALRELRSTLRAAGVRRIRTDAFLGY